ncbi:tegument protein [Psittacid alphaherpesvirus 5]|nr:tegument protein [Psittacid alphaherpesvirus 5]
MSSLNNYALELETNMTREMTNPEMFELSPTCLIDFLFRMDLIPLKDMENTATRLRILSTLRKILSRFSQQFSLSSSIVFIRCLFERIDVVWVLNAERETVTCLREVISSWTRGISEISISDSSGTEKIIEYADMANRWLTSFAALIEELKPQISTFSKTSSIDQYIATLIRQFPIMYGHRFVQTALDHIWRYYFLFAQYNILKNLTLSQSEYPHMRILYTLSLVDAYFSPQEELIDSSELPLAVKTMFENDCREAKGTWTENAFRQVPLIAHSYTQSIIEHNPLKVLSETTSTPHSETIITWKTSLEALFSSHLSRLAFNVPTLLTLFLGCDDAILTESQKQMCLQYASESADTLAMIAEKRESQEKILEHLTNRGFTRKNCYRYIRAAEAPISTSLKGSPLGEMLGAVVHFSLVGNIIYKLISKSNKTSSYIKWYSNVTEDYLMRYSYILDRLDMDNNAILLPLRAFAPTPSFETLDKMHQYLKEIVISSSPVFSEISVLSLRDYENRISNLWEADAYIKSNFHVPYSNMGTHNKKLSDIKHTVSIIWTNTIPLIDNAILDDVKFVHLFIIDGIIQILKLIRDSPFTQKTLDTINKKVCRLRDFGIAKNIPSKHEHRFIALDMHRSLLSFILWHKGEGPLNITQAKHLESSIERLGEIVIGLDEADTEQKNLVFSITQKETRLTYLRLIHDVYEITAMHIIRQVEPSFIRHTDRINASSKDVMKKISYLKSIESSLITNMQNSYVVLTSNRKTTDMWPDVIVVNTFVHMVNSLETSLREITEIIHEIRHFERVLRIDEWNSTIREDASEFPTVLTLFEVHETILNVIENVLQFTVSVTTHVFNRLWQINREWHQTLELEYALVNSTNARQVNDVFKRLIAILHHNARYNEPHARTNQYCDTEFDIHSAIMNTTNTKWILEVFHAIRHETLDPRTPFITSSMDLSTEMPKNTLLQIDFAISNESLSELLTIRFPEELILTKDVLLTAEHSNDEGHLEAMND